jgi:hypothetical protein
MRIMLGEYHEACNELQRYARLKRITNSRRNNDQTNLCGYSVFERRSPRAD